METDTCTVFHSIKNIMQYLVSVAAYCRSGYVVAFVFIKGFSSLKSALDDFLLFLTVCVINPDDDDFIRKTPVKDIGILL